ncbi:unnamed protein product [Ascophyllum nodosum]
MSGDLLRRCAVFGDVDGIKNLLEQGANPCSTDEFGLSALHYAAWNGQVHCVEVLCANDIGRDRNGLQQSCVDLKSNRDFTALHLAATGGVNGVECIIVLLRAGADSNVRNLDGKLALDSAIENGKDECVSALKLEGIHKEEFDKYPENLKVDLKVQRAQWVSIGPHETQESKRRSLKPPSLMIHEDDIRAFSEKAFGGPHGPETIQNLIFAKEQATINEARRKRLADSQHSTLHLSFTKYL